MKATDVAGLLMRTVWRACLTGILFSLKKRPEFTPGRINRPISDILERTCSSLPNPFFNFSPNNPLTGLQTTVIQFRLLATWAGKVSKVVGFHSNPYCRDSVVHTGGRADGSTRHFGPYRCLSQARHLKTNPHQLDPQGQAESLEAGRPRLQRRAPLHPNRHRQPATAFNRHHPQFRHSTTPTNELIKNHQ